jgi:4-hydroxy-3-methylbut-2-en-1-yl diphosphate reductase
VTVVCTPLLVEQVALGRLPGGARVVRTGMGPRPALPEGPAIVAGVAGSLSVDVRPADVVVASEVRGAGAPVAVPSAPLLAGALRRLGLRVHVGPIVSRPKPVDGAARDELAATGALAVDMESAYLAPARGAFAVVRTIVDTPDHPLWRPGTVVRGIRALRALRRAAPAVAQWAAAAHEREVLLGHGTEDADLVLAPGSEVDLRSLAGARRVAITADASAPPHLVDDLVRTLTGLGPIKLTTPREVT